jgi:hypothetical protein
MWNDDVRCQAEVVSLRLLFFLLILLIIGNIGELKNNY